MQITPDSVSSHISLETTGYHVTFNDHEVSNFTHSLSRRHDDVTGVDLSSSVVTSWWFASPTTAASHNARTSFGEEQTPEEDNRYVIRVIFVGMLLSLFILFAVAGNVLVIVAILTDRHLRKTSNYFLVSLAVADALVASVVMTFAVVNEVMEQWPFGDVFCNVWQSADVMCSTASILHLSAVSLDRYINIRQPLQYDRLVTQRRSLLAIAFIWIMSALLSFLPIHLGWHQLVSSENQNSENNFPTIANNSNPHHTPFKNETKTVGDRNENKTDEPNLFLPESVTVFENTGCQLELNMWYAIISSIVSFYAPCVVMISLYWKLYRYAMRQVKRINETLAGSMGSVKFAPSTDSIPVKSLFTSVHRKDSQHSWNVNFDTSLEEGGENFRWRSSSVVSRDRKSFHSKSHYLAGGSSSEMVSVIDMANSQKDFKVNSTAAISIAAVNGNKPAKQRTFLYVLSSGHRWRSSSYRGDPTDIKTSDTCLRKPPELETPCSTPPCSFSGRPSVSYRLRSDHKAAVTLGIIMGVFLVCWMPFFTMNVVSAFYPDIPPVMFSVFTWLGYLNSTMNPVIYGVFNQEFRRAFKHVLMSCYYRCSCDPDLARSTRIMNRTSSGRGGSVSSQRANS